MIHAICVAGARPNLIKIKPVIDGLDSRGAKTTFVHSGQHYDEVMSRVFLNDLGLRQPDLSLGVGSGTHSEQMARVMVAFEPVVGELCPDTIAVVGEVNSIYGCALVAAKAGAVVARVEAGLGSRDWSKPEEVNRVVTDRVNDDLFAPLADAVANLQSEGCRADQIHLVANVMADSSLTVCQRVPGLRRSRWSWSPNSTQRSKYLATICPRELDLHYGRLRRHDQARGIPAKTAYCLSTTGLSVTATGENSPCRGCHYLTCIANHCPGIGLLEETDTVRLSYPPRRRLGLVRTNCSVLSTTQHHRVSRRPLKTQ